MSDKEIPEPEAFRRLVKLTGGSQVRTGELLGWSAEHTSRVARRKNPQPDYVIWLVDLLVALPPKDWPEKWR